MEQQMEASMMETQDVYLDWCVAVTIVSSMELISILKTIAVRSKMDKEVQSTKY